MSAGLRERAATLLATGVTQPPAPRPRWLRLGRLDLVEIADVVVAALCWGYTNGHLGTVNAAHHDGGRLLLASFLVAAPLVLRTRLPLTSWCVSAAAMIWATATIVGNSVATFSSIPAGVLVYALCLYAVAVRCRPWVAITAGAATILGGSAIDLRTTLAAALVALAPVSAGIIVRSRRSNREELAVAERRHEGERALLQERQRIARELHDVVAHHMSVIAIQAEAGPYKIADPPPELVESFAEIRASALTGLNELRRVLGVLRSDRPGTAPAPGLDDLPGLLESARAGGVTVTSEVTGALRPLPEGVDLSAYRIVQEALSNAIRHASGSAVAVKLHYGEAALVIEVRNDRCPPGNGATGQQGAGTLGRGGGVGIIGMRERATMLGGHLSAAPTGAGEFLVTAALPLEHDGPAGSP
ncbi:MAG TPA: histidine kinase [Streptosporangiaceae bacterium]